ncbi:MAG: cation-efflux pump [Actinomycetota bacterium]|nr:cation-efflux pump [Actinomycetota bacterium]
MRAQGGGRAERVALAALVVTVALTGTKLLVWGLTSSLAVLSQALDSALDIVALGLVWMGVRIAAKPADESHHYGHGKAENLAAFVQTVLLGLIVLFVAWQALAELGAERTSVEVPWYALTLFAASAVVDIVRVRFLVRTAREESSVALQAGALNLATDVGTVAVVLVSLALTRVGIEWADPVGSLVVVVAVGVAAIRLGRRSVDVLMDRAPTDPATAIEAAAAGAPGVTETRRVRVRAAGNRLFADVTVAAGRTTSLERAHDIAEAVEHEIELVAPGADVVVHVEPVSETTGFVERVQAAASRTEGVHEVHNVSVHAFSEGGQQKMLVTLHAKVRAGIPLEEAHDMSERVEAAVTRELGPGVRVDTHIEPLEPTSFGRDVTGSREDLVASIRAVALREPDVLDCHEVLITSTGAGLAAVAHVRGRAMLPLDRIHDASVRIENAVRAEHGEVGSIVIHFEPS